MFAGWYVNLELPRVRDARTIHTSDHMLDLVVDPDGTVVRKAEDELLLAVAQGAFDASTATGIEADRAEVEALIAEWEPPFGNGWERFRPGLGWPITFARGLRDLELPL